MDNESEVLFSALDALDKKQLKRFKFYLTNLSSLPSGWTPIPKGNLTAADTTDIVELMIQYNGKENLLKGARDILGKMGQNDLLSKVETWMKRKENVDPMMESDEVQDRKRISQLHKTAMRRKLEFVNEGTVEGKKSKLNRMYTTPQIVRGECEGVNTEHEVMEAEQFRSQKRPDTPFDCNELFSDGYIRTVLTEGVGGIGKTVYIQKFILDWAEGQSNQQFDFVFLLPFRILNSIKDEHYSLHRLLLKFYPELEDLKDPHAYTHCALFIFDGLDESQLNLNFENTLPAQSDSQTVETAITNLIKGEAFPSAKIWITSRPAASRQIPSEYINQVLEAQGFSDPQKEEYFRKNLDTTLATRVIKHIKTTKSLYIMCHMPLFCWMSAMVYKKLDITGKWQMNSSEFPTTLTEMLIHFLHIQTKIKNKKLHDKYEDGRDELWDRHKKNVLKLAKLALEELDIKNFMFSRDHLNKCGIDVKQTSVHSGILTEISQEVTGFFKSRMYCFIHPIIQEFLAALYVFYAYAKQDMNKLRSLSSIRYNALPLKVPLHEILNMAVDGALKSANGHLDLFLRFLLGLSLDSSQELLLGLLPDKVRSSNSIKEACRTIHEKFAENLPPERCINLFHCLLEMKNTTLYKDIKDYGMCGRTDLSPAHCSALASLLLMSEEPLEEFDLRMYKTSEEGCRRLVPVVKWCKKALLPWCKLTDASCTVIASALKARNSQLTELDLSCNDLFDPGVMQLCEGLASSNCGLEVLRLASCSLREESCKSLVPVLTSESSHLQELDLSDNDLGDEGINHLRIGLQSENCNLKSLRLSGCLISELGCGFLATALESNPACLRELDVSYNHLGEDGERLSSLCRLEKLTFSHGGACRLNRGLRKYACELTLDPNTAHQNLHISEDNKSVKHVTSAISNPSHPDRFEYSEQRCVCARLHGTNQLRDHNT
ncbi:hypothetical protein AALO_G00000960 [Alosa alosa]|uniref:Uncharacterized protein n=1 Tax=Alosa alosa TaxID=278164 RepID=A0AAV6HG67_9TELE|nr:hypothetical protein AALO_G00000960 [Alosa alosa]